MNSNNITLIVESNMTNCYYGIYLYYCENCSISGPSWIKGRAPGSYGIYLQRSVNCSITNLNFTNCALYFRETSPGNSHVVMDCYVNGKPLLYLEDRSFISITGDYGEVVLLDCVNITLSGSLVSENSFLEILRSENITIANSELTNLYSIYVKSSDFTTIVNTTIQNSRAVLIDYSDNCTIMNCTLNPTDILVRWSDYCTLNSVVFDSCGLFLYDSTGNSIVDCTVNGKPLVYLENVNGGLVSGDVGQAILVSCENIEVDVNVSNTRVGVELEYSRNCTVRANVTNCTYGIYLLYSDNNTINNCYLESTSYRGISLSFSDFNFITSCIIVDCCHGIYLWDSDYCNITENKISCSGYGVYLWYSYNGFIYLNDFLDFGYFAIGGNSNYTWHSPEPMTYCYMGNEYMSYLGNYYDYAGNDTNRDGIGDEVYSRNGMMDEYPLYETFPHYIQPKLNYLLDLISWVGVFNATFVVGDTSEHGHTGWKAATADVVGAIRVAEAFSRFIGNAFVEAIVDVDASEWTGSEVVIDWSAIATSLLISVGGPDVNYIAYYYNTSLPLYWKIIGGKSYICSETGCYTCSKNYDYAIIALIKDPNSCKLVLIVWGISRRGTQAACLVLQEYNKYANLLNGKAVLIKWTDINSNNKVDREDGIEFVESWD